MKGKDTRRVPVDRKKIMLSYATIGEDDLPFLYFSFVY